MKYILLAAIIFSIAMYSCGNSSQNNQGKNADTRLESAPSGEILFNQNCKVCHSLNAAASSGMAPVLDSVKTHWIDKNALASFIKNASENKNVNAHTTALFAEWQSKPQMPPFMGFTDKEVIAIAEYLYQHAN